MNKNELLVSYGDDAAAMTRELLEAAQLAQAIPAGAKIGIKPNLVVARPCSDGATTSPVIAGALVEYLQAHGHKNIIILEGSWVGDSTKRAFKTCGYEAVAMCHDVPLFDTKDDHFTKVSAGGIEMELSNMALGLDFLINLPVMKGHCQTKITGALKNMKGCISDGEKRHFHALGLDKPIGYLNTLLHTDFVLVDGLCGDLDFEEGGNPVRMNRIICGTDPVLVDSYLATQLGYLPEEIGHIVVAAQQGVGSMDIDAATITMLRKDNTKAKAMPTRKVQKLAGYANQKEACSACYANLIHALKRLENEGSMQQFQKTPVCIGQGFQTVQQNGIGVGKCTSGFSQTIGGCPPTAIQMLDFLREQK